MRRWMWLGMGFLICGIWLYAGLGESKVPVYMQAEAERKVAYVGMYSLPWLPAFRPTVEVNLPEPAFLKAPVSDPELDMGELQIKVPSTAIDVEELISYLDKQVKPLPEFPKIQKVIPKGLNRIWEGK